MITTCGLVIKSRGLYLLCHPTGAVGDNRWDIPKGQMEENESELETACRETLEETGLNIKELKKDYDLSLLGRFKYYGRPKELVAFLLEYDGDLTERKLECLSYIDYGKMRGQPEHDDFAWVDLEKAILMTHKTVSKIFKKVAEYS